MKKDEFESLSCPAAICVKEHHLVQMSFHPINTSGSFSGYTLVLVRGGGGDNFICHR